MRLLETCAYGIKACFCLSRSAIAAFTAAAARWAGARAEGCGTTCCGTRPEEVAQVGGSAPGVRMERVKYRERTAGPRGRTAPLSQRRPKSAVRPALPAVPLRAMPVAPRFRHGAVAAPACLPIRASLFSLVFYCPKRKSRSPTRCCFPSTRAGTGLQQEAAGSGLSDPGRRRPARHGSAGPLCAAPHRAAPPRAVPTRLRSPTAAPARRAHPQLARSTAAARGRVTCPRDSGTSRQHTPPTPQRNATQRLPPGSPQAPRSSSSSARPAGQRGGAILPAEGLFRGAGGRGNSVDIGHVRGGAAPIAAAELDPTARGSGAPRGAAGGRVFSGGRGWRRGRPASTGP